MGSLAFGGMVHGSRLSAANSQTLAHTAGVVETRHTDADVTTQAVSVGHLSLSLSLSSFRTAKGTKPWGFMYRLCKCIYRRI